MDTLTHSLVGVALSRTFFKKRVVYATTACIVAANLPDLDVIYSWPGIRYLEYHRGILHSIWMLPLWALLVGFGLQYAARRYHKTIPPLWMGFALGATCVASHLLLDWTNAYGIRLLAPFHQAWYALDWLPIFDPWIWLLLAAFLGFPMLLGLITNEIGATKQPPHRVSAALALILLAGWVGLRARQHAAALTLLNQPNVSGIYNGEQPNDWSALPESATPYEWQALIDLPSSYLTATINAPWDWEDYGNVHPVRRFVKPPSTTAIQLAQSTHTGSIMMWFARYPMSDEELQGTDTVVYITDMRFAQGSRRPPLRAEVRLNDSLSVIHQGFSWSH